MKQRARKLLYVVPLALVVGLLSAAADEPTEAAKPAVAKFDHELHAKSPKIEESLVTEDSCQSCHPTDKAGTLTNPGKSGHQPCLQSGCHVDDFLSVGPDKKASDPAAYRKAAAFCAGCHGTDGGEPPKRHEKPASHNIFTNNPSPNYHVELTHFEHISKETQSGRTVGCRDCHVVDPASNQLQLDTPGHTQCSTCHGVNATPMSECGQCHEMPGPREYFDKLRDASEVRSCGSEGHRAEARRRGKPPEKVSCFKHETKSHRFQEDGKPLECSTCHYMFTDKRYWGRHKYDTLKNIASAPAMDDVKDKAHQMCGRSRACHARDVRSAGNNRQCELCHSRKTVENEMFD